MRVPFEQCKFHENRYEEAFLVFYGRVIVENSNFGASFRKIMNFTDINYDNNFN
jgi:hypothetical protein